MKKVLFITVMLMCIASVASGAWFGMGSVRAKDPNTTTQYIELNHDSAAGNIKCNYGNIIFQDANGTTRGTVNTSSGLFTPTGGINNSDQNIMDAGEVHLDSI